MATYTVYGTINDGYDGFPNIQAQLSWDEQTCNTYHKALAQFCINRGAGLINAVQTSTGKNLNGRPYREYDLEIRCRENGAEAVRRVRIYRNM